MSQVTYRGVPYDTEDAKQAKCERKEYTVRYRGILHTVIRNICGGAK